MADEKKKPVKRVVVGITKPKAGGYFATRYGKIPNTRDPQLPVHNG